MIELTPLDVRKKKGDFRRALRGYEAAQVDDFLDVVADRMEVLVREAVSIRERIAKLEQQVAEYRDREKAMTEALVTAQQMREDIRTRSTQEVEVIRQQAQQEALRLKADAQTVREKEEVAFRALQQRQTRFLDSYRSFLEREMNEIAVMARKVAALDPTGAAAPAIQPSHESTHAPSTQPASVQPGPVIQRAPETVVPQAATAPPAHAQPRPESAAHPPAAARMPEPGKPGALSKKTKSSDEELDAQLAQALARWEPELEADKSRTTSAAAGALPADDDEEDFDLLLEDNDVVSAAEPAAKPTGSHAGLIDDLAAEDEELDAELAELLGPDPVRSAPPARKPAAPAAPVKAPKPDLSGEVNAAMVNSIEADGYIDLDEAFGEPPPSFNPTTQNSLPELKGSAEPARPDDAAASAQNANAIELENYNSLETFPASNEVDTSGLTLHPMFFEKDSRELPAMIRPGEDKRHPPERGERWAGGDKG